MEIPDMKWYSKNAWIALATAGLGAAVAFGVPISDSQTSAVLVLIGAVAAFLGAKD
jgi:hypothetical protein